MQPGCSVGGVFAFIRDCEWSFSFKHMSAFSGPWIPDCFYFISWKKKRGQNTFIRIDLYIYIFIIIIIFEGDTEF